MSIKMEVVGVVVSVNSKVDVLRQQAAEDSGKLADATVVTVGCSKEEFDKHHRIRPLEEDMEILLTQVNLPCQYAVVIGVSQWCL